MMGKMYKTEKALSDEELAEKWRRMKIEGQQAFPLPIVASIVEDSDGVIETAKAALDEDEE